MAPSDYSDRQLEDALRKEVKSIIATGKLEGLTVNAVRSQAERALDLPAGYFKNDSKWKDRSKNVITKAAVSSMPNMRILNCLANFVVTEPGTRCGK